MKLIIKNKNFVDGKEKEFNVVKGAPITKEFNETLDVATVIIPQIKEEIEIEPLDEVRLVDDKINTRFLCVSNIEKRQLSVRLPIFYQYTIKLVSQTKLMEGYVLPSLKITQKKANVKYQNDIYFYLEKYLKAYGPKIRARDTFGDTHFNPKWHFSSRVLSRFGGIECPEMQWNNPTLREVFNDLMMIDDCIVTLNNNEIDFMDISKIGEDITKDENKLKGINFIHSSQSAEDYVSDLKMNMENAMQTEVEGIDNTVSVCEHISLRTDDYVITTENILAETMYPILRIKKLVIGFVSDWGTDASGDKKAYLEKDIANINENGVTYSAIYEEKEFQTKKVLYNLNYSSDLSSWEKLTSYQNFTLYYSRGSNKILGFTKLTKNMPIIGADRLAIQYITSKIVNEVSGVNVENFKIWGDARDIFLKIEYETTVGASMKVGRYLPRRNHREIVDNQTNSYVDTYSQGALEYAKANRLGNEILVLNARYDMSNGIIDENSIPDIGDTYKDNVIFKKEMTVFDNHIDVNYYATKNYVLRDYFTGVRSKIRSWQIVSGNEALKRHDLRKVYFEFSYSQKNEVGLDDLKTSFLPYKMLSPLYSRDYAKPLTGCAVRFKYEDGLVFSYFPSSTIEDGIVKENYYILDFSSRLAGNSILLTFGMNDNFNVAKYIDNFDFKGGYVEKNYVYADKYGNNIGFEIRYLDEYDSAGGKLEWPINGQGVTTPSSSTNSDIEKMRKAAGVLPRVTEDAFFKKNSIFQKVDLYKDNAEITWYTTQFELCSDTENIVFGKEFMRKQQIISNETNDVSGMSIYLSDQKINLVKHDTFDINIGNNYKAEDAKLVVDSINGYSSKISISGIPPFKLFEYPYTYVVMGKKILIAFKHLRKDTSGQYYATKKIYLNMLRDRDCNVYDGKGEIVDKI